MTFVPLIFMNIHDKYHIQYGRLSIAKTELNSMISFGKYRGLKIGFLQALIKPIFMKNLDFVDSRQN